MARRKQSFFDDLDGLMLGTLVCCAIAGASLLAFFFFKALLSSPYAVIELTLLAGALFIMLVVSIFSR